MITTEQLKAIMEMGDIGGLEDEQSQMFALAKQLRGAAPTYRGGKDTWGNVGRAAYGIGGAIGDYKGLQKNPQISGGKQSLLARLMREMQLGQQRQSGMGGGEGPVAYEE
jgi:hypothetical protein